MKLEKEKTEQLWKLLRNNSINELADEYNIKPRSIIAALKGETVGIGELDMIQQMLHEER